LKGRRPLPTALKLVKGSRRARLNPDEPSLPVEAPPCPDWLTGVARVTWQELSELLVSMRVLSVADRAALAQMCAAVATYRAAHAVVERDGMTFTATTEHGTVTRARPEVAIMQDADRRIRAWANEFGLTPAGRPRVKAAPFIPGNPFDLIEGGTTQSRRRR
jgi:P27 family predicted phage terminase small subunit